MQAIVDHLNCPKCGQPPTWQTDHFGCLQCGAQYPSFQGIPALLEDAPEWIARWTEGLVLCQGRLQREINDLHVDRKRSGLTELTLNRLSQLIDGKTRILSWVNETMAPLMMAYQALNLGALPRPSHREPTDPFQYYENLLRDWVWSTQENEAALARLKAALGSESLGRTLVLGAGGGRLAWDLSQEPCEHVVAIDLHPGLFLAAAKVLKGDPTDWIEIPEYPKSVKDAAKDYHVAARGISPRLYLIFADGFGTALRSESFDTIVTPWFIDIVPLSLEILAPKLNRLLKPGGKWLNIGPLTYGRKRPADRMSVEETVKTVELNGFQILKQDFSSIPYLQSPLESRSRTETVLSFAAKKTGPAAPAREREFKPSWAKNHHTSVADPRLNQALGFHRMYERVLSLVDGKRTVAQIASELSTQWQMPKEKLESEIVDLLLEVIDR